jgi:hypothetical protein
MGNNGIDAYAAMTLISNYTQNHLDAINCDQDLTDLRQGGASSDSRSVWFSLTALNTFIGALQSNAANNCGINGNLGVRMYFGEYPDADSSLWGTNSFPANFAQYAGMQTIVMVPTYYNGAVNMDFDPAFPGAHLPLPIAQVCNIATNTDTMQQATGQPNTAPLSMLDHGSLSPPPFILAGQYGALTGAAFLDVVDA